MSTSRAPAQRGGVDRSIPQLDQVVIELDQRQRRARHLERRDVAAHEPAHRLEAGFAQAALDLAVEQVELELRGTAHPVHEREHLRAAGSTEVTDDGLDHDVRDLVRAAELGPPAPRLAVDPDATLHLAFGQLEDRLPGGGWRA